jgi:hypothetical protein
MYNASLFFINGSTWMNKLSFVNAFSSIQTPFERDYKAVIAQSIYRQDLYSPGLTPDQINATLSDVISTINGITTINPQPGPINIEDINNSTWYASHFFITGSTWRDKLQIFNAIASIQNLIERNYRTNIALSIYRAGNLRSEQISQYITNVTSIIREIETHNLQLSNATDEFANITKNAELLFIKGSTWKHKLRVINALSSIQDPTERDAKTQLAFFPYMQSNTDNFKHAEIMTYFDNIISTLNG